MVVVRMCKPRNDKAATRRPVALRELGQTKQSEGELLSEFTQPGFYVLN
jgi:hypothetical protein